MIDLLDELTYYCETGEHWDHEDNGTPVRINDSLTCPECLKSEACCKNCDEVWHDDHKCMAVAA